MGQAPLFSAEEDSANEGFAALLSALSRPGLVQTLPEASDAPIVRALLDRECTAHAEDPLLIPLLMEVGAQVQPRAAAEYCFLGVLDSTDALRDLRQGSDLYPDDGATAIVQARFDLGPLLAIAGPGVNGTVRQRIGGLPDGFWQMRQSLLRYPTGFDLFFRDGNRIIGIPRSTSVEVL